MAARRRVLLLATTALTCFLFAVRAHADDGRPAALRDVGLDQKLNAQVPLDLLFLDENGRPVRLGDYFGTMPVVLTLNYFDCPMLCPLVLNDVLRVVRAMPLALGRDFRIVTVSIDPQDTPARAASKQRLYAEQYGRPGGTDAWHFLTGSEDSVGSLAGAVGFRFGSEPQSRQYAHAAGIMVLTASGRIARYFYGVEYSPRDLRRSLVEASKGRIGSLADQILLFCFHYDPVANRYTLAVLNTIRVAGVATVLGVGSLMVVLFQRERRKLGRPDGGRRDRHAV